MKVITLCGSTRFMDAYAKANIELTLKGNVVFSVAKTTYEGSEEVTPDQKLLLDRVHFEKISRSDEIFVLNVGGYIGPSTRNKIEFATKLGKKVTYLEPIGDNL